MLRARGIAVKLALVLLLVGILPMVTLGVVTYLIARDSITETSIAFFVERVAQDTATNLELLVSGKREGTRLLANSASLRRNVLDVLSSPPGSPDYETAVRSIRDDLNRQVDILGTVDLLVVARRDGQVIVTNNRARASATGLAASGAGERDWLWGGEADANPYENAALFEYDWWPLVAGGDLVFIDAHREAMVIESYAYPTFLDEDADRPDEQRRQNPEAYSFAFACGIPEPDDSALGDPGRAMAIVVAFHNWSAVQGVLDTVNESFEHHPRYSSAYTFMFAEDMNSIIGHRYLQLYGGRLVEDHGLPDFREAMMTAEEGVGSHRYFYNKAKISGFAPVPSTGWRVGFGINEEDFDAESDRLRVLVITWALVAAALIVLLVVFISPRFTRPIRELMDQAGQIAKGNLDARVKIDTGDELEELGSRFNSMAEELDESSRRLVQAEKTAAWQEMARQVAHEIKNPLTPMKLSAQLLEKAYRDRHHDFDRILRTSVKNIVDQIESLRDIATEFSDYASFPRTDRKPQRLVALIEECIALYRSREDSGVEIALETVASADLEVLVDRDEMKRVFINLFNNALEAMPEGGRLTVSILPLEDEEGRRAVHVRVRDTGVGIPEEILPRLFEPYFTTRSSGTGLGLAIARKTIESAGGTIAISSRPGEGTCIDIELPIHAPGSGNTNS